MCVAKLHDINAQLVEDQGFLDLLKDLLSDSTPMVVANAVAALAEIGEVSPTGTLFKYACLNAAYLSEDIIHIIIHVHTVDRDIFASKIFRL